MFAITGSAPHPLFIWERLIDPSGVRGIEDYAVDGEVIECGTHEELLRLNGHYAEPLQSKPFEYQHAGGEVNTRRNYLKGNTP